MVGEHSVYVLLLTDPSLHRYLNVQSQPFVQQPGGGLRCGHKTDEIYCFTPVSHTQLIIFLSTPLHVIVSVICALVELSLQR